MVNTVKFAGLLWLLFFVLAQGDSTEYIKQDEKRTITSTQNGDGTFVGQTRRTVDQESFNGFSTKTAVSNKRRLQGRKMLVDNDVKEMRMKDGVVVLNNGVSSMISDAGKGKIASKKSVGASPSQHNLNDDQNHGKMLKPRSGSVDGLPNTNQLKYFQESKANAVCSSLEGSHKNPSQRFEQQKLHQAPNEFMNMMHKDYNGYDKPRRKPPINNYEPLGGNYSVHRPHRQVAVINNEAPLDVNYSPLRKPSMINTNELVDDYSKPAPKPRRKPPINNNEPLVEENNVKP